MSQVFLKKNLNAFAFCSAILGLHLTGCGYAFQNSRSSSLAAEGVNRIYVAPIRNSSYKPGVENLVYNQLVRSLAASGRVTLVHHRLDADAILDGTVDSATMSPSGGASVSSLQPTPLGASLPSKDFQIPGQYSASLGCTFRLTRRVHVPRKSDTIWSGVFGRGKPFPGANQLDVPGTTSPLINDSEFDRALGDLAKSIMEDVVNSMAAKF